MNYKKYTHRLLLSLFICGVIIILFSCENDLREYNPAGLTAETTYQNAEGFESLINAAYSYERWFYGKHEGYNFSEMGTDLWSRGADGRQEFTIYKNLEGDGPFLNEMYQHLYEAINVINYGITGIDEVEDYKEDIKEIRKAELHFLRGFFYWHVVETWGDSPMPLEPTNEVKTDIIKTPIEDIYDQIFEDLEYAVDHLSESTQDFGRVTKPAAEAFLARMYITRGENQKAYELAKKVIENYGFELIENYADLWPMDKMQMAEDNEVIYSVNYTKDLNLNDRKDDVLFPNGHKRGGNNGHLDFTIKYDDLPGMERSVEYGRPFIRFVPTRFLLDLFNTNIDSRYKGSFQTVWYRNNLSSGPEGMQVGDTAVWITKKVIPESVRGRKVYRIYDRNDVYYSNGKIKDNKHAVQLIKFMDPTRGSANEEVSSRDVFVIRLSEMYLIAAEAQFRLGNTDKAADYLNIIRRRAAIPGHETEMEISSTDVTLDFVLDEYAREFAGEQMRWFLLKRTGKLIERVRKYNPDAGENIQDYHLVRPIPQDQIDAVTNPDEFQQNPGYQ